MLANDALYAMTTLALFSGPLFLVWFIAIGVGITMLPKCRPAALCLMAAGVLEVLRLGLQVAIIPLPVMLIESGTLGSAGLRWFGLGRALVSVAMVVVSHGLLLFAIYGWRTRS